MTGPNPLLWIWYTLGGKLGSPYREWVLHDTACRTRWLRQILSFMDLIVLPTAVVLAMLGVSWSGRSESATTWMRPCTSYRPIGRLPSSASPNPLL